MQQESKNVDIEQRSQLEENLDGLKLAQYFKFYRQYTNSYKIRVVPVNQLSVKTFYRKYQKYFDLLSTFCSKHRIDSIDYINFFITIDFKTEKDIPQHLVSGYSFKKYFENLQKILQQKKICKLFVDTAETIANECIQNNLLSCKDFFRNLIQQKKLANYYISGKLSIYFLATIPKFYKIVPKLDYFSRCELTTLAERYDLYNTQVNDAFLAVTSKMVNPIEFTDNLIREKREKKYSQTF